MNDFENEIKNTPYHRDWKIYYESIKGVVKKYLLNANKSNCFRDNININYCTLQVIAFHVYGNEYVWIESIDPTTRLRDGFQLERAITKFSSKIIVSSNNSSMEMYPAIVKLVSNGKLLIM